MIICSEQDMKQFGADLIQSSDSPGVITLKGDLGTGKTTIVRGALESCGITTGVRSPTYTLVEYYELDNFSIAHFDLYRLGDPEELEYLGYRDYLRPDTWCFIEWPERAEGYLDNIGLELSIQYQDECRKLEATVGNHWGQQLISAMNLT
ncbi:MAG: tRNA (adenosine(37)-N6)-threonylcarbamoyltransferase complex ATPase subunit type 1 TsaE [Gammaproteobacteria bacterium]|jgi:tRNA threonylcarbamoyladenosine biosynthesis protein TsaE|nr:tRNA (adenosine(37)-N6)-threonylcarbamoyltransferase complex ATPase subunit type 1 TsaE [Gammaproteobacteria bacterium]MBT3723794.1 tRNA (adenosine(37)-N6)-threonylcarbamoyltransferase complex ATPase subunit type 1 TsaE [Gammaproteobacteria bacterium]MBT4077582.1 tRNA (adenosine(37)-N6)-threonylcarbamoyltransferase complex ATPase subunit type 1 TsaE [Gammaproteobacteria bacterium]MBT4196412.1 tRNA (adenosine(37)-N6)-threonylcarbamoyltransferase complex ATPase subunit type 1 TsaE [Gammaproteob